jgi:predicted oxidoreductase
VKAYRIAHTDLTVSGAAIAPAWLLRLPAGFQPIVGTTQVGRLLASCQADTVSLTREEWYALFAAVRVIDEATRAEEAALARQL